MLAENAFEEKE